LLNAAKRQFCPWQNYLTGQKEKGVSENNFSKTPK